MASSRVDPLTINIPIVDSRGFPTPEFMRKWSQQHATNGTIPDLSTPAAVSAVLDILGAQKGDMLIRDTDVWRALLLSAIMDQAFGATRGTVIFRGATEWKGLGPGTAGNVLTTKGSTADPEWDAAQSGFGFFVGGLMTNNELLGACDFPQAMTFTNGDPKSIVKTLSPAAVDADMTFVANPAGGAPATVGTIHFAAGAFSGTVAWSASPYTLPAGYVLLLYAPSPADVQLSLVSGTINGSPG